MLDEILPPPAVLAHPLTGEIIDRDDLPAIKAALVDAKNWSDENRRVYKARDLLQERLAELSDPVEVPRRAYQTRYQQALTNCPRCGTKVPRMHIEEAE